MTSVHTTVGDRRAKWQHHAEFVLSCIGFSVGLGNVWRFPYLCYKHGGAAFLLVYLFLQLTVGKPLYFLELSLGQYAGKNPVGIWDLNPAARGIGLSMILVSLNVSLYYNVIMAYVLYYLFASLQTTLPWQYCRPEWERCINDQSVLLPHCLPPNTSRLTGSGPTVNCTCTGDKDIDRYYQDCVQPFKYASTFYFRFSIYIDKAPVIGNWADLYACIDTCNTTLSLVIQESADFEDFGYPSWKLSLLLLLSWVVVISCMIRGIKSTGKVVYFTAVFPYFILFVLLVRGASLDGAADGILAFIVPKWSAMANPQLWIDATGQMFFSLGLSMGAIIMFSSYNYFHHAIYRDALLISGTDLVTSLLAGIVVFSTFGFMAKRSGTDLLHVTKSGYGLAFEAYPQTLSNLSLPNLWSCFFFFMFYTLGLDSQFATLETCTTYLIDDFVWCRRHATLLRVICGVILYCLGIILVCPGGQHVITAVDVYGVTYPATVLCLLETISVMWVYGMNRFLGDLEYMLGQPLRGQAYWNFVWVIWSPLFLVCVNITVLMLSEIPKYPDQTPFGPGAVFFCWLVYAYTISPIPLWFFLHVKVTYTQHGYGSFLSFCTALFKPLGRWGPADGRSSHTRLRQGSVWTDVLEWRILQRKQSVCSNTESVSSIPCPPVVAFSGIQAGHRNTSDHKTQTHDLHEESFFILPVRQVEDQKGQDQESRVLHQKWSHHTQQPSPASSDLCTVISTEPPITPLSPST